MGAGRPAGSPFSGKFMATARAEASNLIGSADDPLMLALEYVRDERCPWNIRGLLLQCVIAVTYPKLSAQVIQSTSAHLHISAGELAAKTALLLEHGPVPASPTLEELGFTDLEGQAQEAAE